MVPAVPVAAALAGVVLFVTTRLPAIVTVPPLLTLILLVPPIRRSMSRLAALLAVSVMFTFTAVGVPDVFHVPASSAAE